MQATQQPIAFDTQGNIIIPGIHSDNYVPGVSGWTINQDGTAEFNDVTIRGTVVASVFETRASGQRITINEGNNNSMWVYDSTGNSVLLSIGDVAGVLTSFDRPDGLSMDIATAGLVFNSVHGGSILTPDMFINETPDSSRIIFNTILNGGLGLSITQPQWSVLTPGSTAYEAAVTPTLGTGWAPASTTGTYQPIQYWRDALGNTVISGVFNATSATPAGTVFTLGVGYRPPVAIRVPVASFSNTGVPVAGQTHVVVNASGVIQVSNNAAIVVGQNYSLSVTIPRREIV